MARKRNEKERIDPKVKRWVREVIARYSPTQIIMFGSRARNEHLNDSDYDFVVVSERFEGVPFIKRMSDLLELWTLPVDVDILPYTPEEFRVKSSHLGTVQEAVDTGRKLYPV